MSTAHRTPPPSPPSAPHHLLPPFSSMQEQRLPRGAPAQQGEGLHPPHFAPFPPHILLPCVGCDALLPLFSPIGPRKQPGQEGSSQELSCNGCKPGEGRWDATPPPLCTPTAPPSVLPPLSAPLPFSFQVSLQDRPGNLLFLPNKGSVLHWGLPVLDLGGGGSCVVPHPGLCLEWGGPPPTPPPSQLCPIGNSRQQRVQTP